MQEFINLLFVFILKERLNENSFMPSPGKSPKAFSFKFCPKQKTCNIFLGSLRISKSLFLDWTKTLKEEANPHKVKKFCLRFDPTDHSARRNQPRCRRLSQKKGGGANVVKKLKFDKFFGFHEFSTFLPLWFKPRTLI